MLSVKLPEPIPDNSAGDIDAAVNLNLCKCELLFKRIYDKFFGSVDLADSKVAVELNKNERNPLEYYAPGVVIDNRPVHLAQLFFLERRGRLQIKKHCWHKAEKSSNRGIKQKRGYINLQLVIEVGVHRILSLAVHVHLEFRSNEFAIFVHIDPYQ